MKVKELFKSLEGYNKFAEMCGESQREIKCYIQFGGAYQASNYKEFKKQISEEYSEDYVKELENLDIELGEKYEVRGDKIDFFFVEI